MNFATILHFLAALMLAFVWAAYLRKINVFKTIRWYQVIVIVSVGALTTIPVIFIDLPEIPATSGVNITLQKLVYYLYNVAFLEEAAKLIGFGLVFLFFRKWFREEPNYIIFSALVALGFATVENFMYFYSHGIHLVYMREMMSTFSHIIYTSIAVGFLCIGLRKNILFTILHLIAGLVVATVIHGIFDFFIVLKNTYFYIITLIIFIILIEVWARMMNNFLNFSKAINPRKSIDRNTLQRFLFISFFAAGLIQLVGFVYLEGFQEGINSNLKLITQELIITLILIVRITRFTIIPRRWKKIYPTLPIALRRGKFQKSVIPTSPMFFLKIKGDEFNEYPFTSTIGDEVKLVSLPNKKFDFELELNVKMIEKKFLGRKNDLYYLCELIDFHTIHPQYNSRYLLIRPKNYGKQYQNKLPMVGVIVLKGFTDLDHIAKTDCKFISWMAFKPKGKKTPRQSFIEMLT